MSTLTRLDADASIAAINAALDADGVVIVEHFYDADWVARYNGEVQPFIDNHKRTYTGVDVFDDFLTITYRRNLAADDVLIVLELSFDLVNWVSGDTNLTFVSEIHQGDGTSLVRYRTNFPHDPATQSRVFLRLHVSLP